MGDAGCDGSAVFGVRVQSDPPRGHPFGRFAVILESDPKNC